MSTARRAKSRLTDFEIQEVSVVDAAANLRRFAVIKRNTMTTSANKTELKLPKAVKDAMMDVAGQVLDQVTALAEVISAATEDDTAAVPPDLVAAFDAGAKMLAGVASQFAAASDAPPPPEGAEGEGAPPPPPGEEEQKGAPPFPPKPGGKDEEDEETKKGLPAPETDPLKLSTTVSDTNLASLMRKAIAAAHLEIAEVEKAGRKMAGARYQKLVDLHEGLGKLLNELAFDEASAGAPSTGKSQSKKSAAEEAGDDRTAALLALVETAKSTSAALQAQLTELRGEQVAKGLPAPAGGSNAGAIEGAGAPPPVVWEPDMSAAVAKKKAARR